MSTKLYRETTWVTAHDGVDLLHPPEMVEIGYPLAAQGFYLCPEHLQTLEIRTPDGAWYTLRDILVAYPLQAASTLQIRNGEWMAVSSIKPAPPEHYGCIKCRELGGH